MPRILMLLGAAGALLAADTVAADSQRDYVKTRVELESGSVEFDSRRDGFSLGNLVDGETVTVDDGSGRSIIVSRAGDLIMLDVDGVRYELVAPEPPAAPAEPPVNPADVEALVLPDGLTIFGAERMSVADRQRLKQAIIATGLTRKVTFVAADDAESDSLTWSERHTILHDAGSAL